MCRGVSGHVPLLLRRRLLLSVHYCNGKKNLSTLLIRKLMHTYSLDLHLADFRTK
jgi:CTP:molybdopterin cytidylyltransferase MocA